MRAITSIVLALSAGLAFAKLPPPSDAMKAQAAEATAKSAWSDKVAAFQLCRAQDKAADAYRRNVASTGKPALSALPTPGCADPGPYVSPVAQESTKPLEASGAHSPPETAKAPPSSNVTAAQIADGQKK